MKRPGRGVSGWDAALARSAVPSSPSEEPTVPDQTVRVSFDPRATPKFKVDCETVRMTAAGKVILQRRPRSATWTFLVAKVKRDKLRQFSSTVRGIGRSLHINDEFKDKKTTSYSYNVTVKLGRRIYTSPDPVIVNDPGG
jgi:hypothetical protein